MVRFNRLSAGEIEFLVQLYQEYRFFMLRTARSIVKDHMLAEDIVGDVICNLIVHVERISSMNTTQMRALLYVATRNMALKYLRDWVQKNVLISLQDLTETRVVADPMMEDSVVSKLDSEALLDLIEQHDPRAAQMLKLRVIEGHSYEEIASLFGVSGATARSRYYRSRNLANYILQRELRLIAMTNPHYERRRKPV